MTTGTTWYSREGSRWAEIWTIFHPPYTGMVVCYVLLGGLLAPTIHLDRLLWIVVAYILGLGFGAHALDQLSGRPYGRSFSKAELWLMAITSLAAACAIGGYYAVTVSPWLWLFIALETFFAVTYNLDRLFRGRFHTDGYFVLSWGVLPFLVSYFIQTLSLSASAFLMALALGGTAAMEITLSRWVRALRRNPARFLMLQADGKQEEWDVRRLIGRPERALKLLVLTVYFLTVGLAARRWWGP